MTILFNKEITVRSPANIAFIKYWGQKNTRLILPFNDSFSMNLSNCYTEMSVVFLPDKNIKEYYFKDYRGLNFYLLKEAEPKIEKFINTIKEFLHIKDNFGYKMYSTNSFPIQAGIASSASFYSSLTLATVTGLGLKLLEKQLSVLARLSGSGSACRSIPDGFCWWKKGDDSQSSYARSIADENYWDLVDLVLLLSLEKKKTTSQEAHPKAITSHYFTARIKDVEKRLKLIKRAFLKKDFSCFGTLIEEEAISLHIVMMTQKPPLFYWGPRTISTIKKIHKLRKQGVEAYFTIDAGENVHLICQRNDQKKIFDYFIKQPEVVDIIINSSCKGARIEN